MLDGLDKCLRQYVTRLWFKELFYYYEKVLLDSYHFKRWRYDYAWLFILRVYLAMSWPKDEGLPINRGMSPFVVILIPELCTMVGYGSPLVEGWFFGTPRISWGMTSIYVTRY